MQKTKAKIKELPFMANLLPVEGKVKTPYGVREQVNDPEWGPMILMDGKPVLRPSGYEYKPPDQEDFDPNKDRDYTSKALRDWMDETGILKLHFFFPVMHVATLTMIQAVSLLEGFIPHEWERNGKGRIRSSRRLSKASMKKIHELRWLKNRAKWIHYPRYGKSGNSISLIDERHVRDVVVKLNYPMHLGSKLTIHPYKTLPRGKFHNPEELSVGYILWLAALEYKRIYQNAEKYGVWGHQISDLSFEGMTLHRNGKINLWVGS